MNSSDVGSGADPSQLAVLRELLETGKPVRIRKAIGELVLIRDDGSALALAARYIGTAGWSAEALIRMWPKVADPDGFCAASWRTSVPCSACPTSSASTSDPALPSRTSTRCPTCR
ncbi:hypothetical protein [Streptomyces prunicolor]|jgi:hypothetical protein|uniref:hypothetical protein n=1 Tax=Streptomyces prunicolor TaxID=67348 RepID=UPI00036CD6B3|nr:hypothetical protein [Streptomyces prunicolor]